MPGSRKIVEVVMGCVALLALLIGPRIALVVLWLTSNLSALLAHWGGWAIVGWLLIPWTTLWYAWVSAHGAEWSVWRIVVLVVALLVDLGGTSAGARRRRERG